MDRFVQSRGHPLELLILSKLPHVRELLTGIESDYPLWLAQKGIALNTSSLISDKSQPLYKILEHLSSETLSEEQETDMVRRLEFEYMKSTLHFSTEELKTHAKEKTLPSYLSHL